MILAFNVWLGSWIGLHPTVGLHLPFWLRQLLIAGDHSVPPAVLSPCSDICFPIHISARLLDYLIFDTIPSHITKIEPNHASGVFLSNDNVKRKSGEPLGEV